LVILLAVGVYLWARSKGRQAQERRGLRWFSLEQVVGEDDRSYWEADLVSMTATVDRPSPDGFAEDDGPPAVEYTLRRNDNGRWSLRLTDASRQARLGWVRARLAETGFAADMFRSTWESNRDALQTPTKWESVPADVAAPLESQYQRFLLHWKED
jgi:hypothetical protein